MRGTKKKAIEREFVRTVPPERRVTDPGLRNPWRRFKRRALREGWTGGERPTRYRWKPLLP